MLTADWKITTAVRTQGSEHVQTEYFKGRLTRTQSDRYVMVLDLAHFRQTMWAPDLRQYATHRLGRGGAPQPSDSTLVIDSVTTDTGERKNFFGRSASHFVTRESRHGPNVDSQTTIDAWYVDAGTLPPQKRSNVVLVLSAGGRPPRLELNRTGPVPKGIAVWQKSDTTWNSLNGRTEENHTVVEVTELEETSLPMEMFEPPPGFTRVVRFPGDYYGSWIDDLRLHWEAVTDWFLTALGK